jgi:murein DD-endopeptidase MepM/ murein hydrolase activator NlpD
VAASSIAFYEYYSYTPKVTELQYEVAENADDVDLQEPDEASLLAEESDVDITSIKATADTSSQNEKFLVVGKGDTFASLLSNEGLDKKQTQLAVDAIKKVYNPKELKIGQGIKVKLEKDPISEEIILTRMEWRSSPEQEIIVEQKQGDFKAQKKQITLKKAIEGVAGKIKSSFYYAAVKGGAPSHLVKSAITALSYDVNFQHDPKPGNGFAMLYEVYKDQDGNIVKYGNLLYAAFAPSGSLKQVYRFDNNGAVSFYNAKGETIARGFLRSPLDASRIRVTSGFGMRMHPLKGYTRQHNGIDFGAPRGTAVVAAASGTVTRASYWGDFGLYVSIKHGDYTTEYAHLSNIDPKIKVGAKVTQGQVIGAVGSTGSSTAPHLHYGVLCKGAHINPNSVKALPSPKLQAKELAKFASLKKELDEKVIAKPNNGEYVLAINEKLVG